MPCLVHVTVNLVSWGKAVNKHAWRDTTAANVHRLVCVLMVDHVIMSQENVIVHRDGGEYLVKKNVHLVSLVLTARDAVTV